MSFILTAKAMTIRVGSPLTKLVLIKLCDNANDEGECFPSYKTIAFHCEMSRRTVINHVNRLEKMGIITKEFRDQKTNVFTINLMGAYPAPASESPAPASESPALGGESPAHGERIGLTCKSRPCAGASRC